MNTGARVWLCLSLGLYAGACASSDGKSCGGPTSDFPFCEDQKPTNDEGSEFPDDSEGNSGAEPPASADGGAVECAPSTPMCEGASTPLAITGQAPSGALALEGVALGYREGDTNATELHFFGKLDQAPFALDVVLPAAEGTGSVANVGVYTTGEANAPVSSSVALCGSSTPVAVSVSITSHDAVALDGSAGNLRGMLEVREPNWTLAVPFEITQACTRITN